MVITRFLGPSGKIPVLIRDDDTNFFTKSEMLEPIYSKAWKSGFKVCLSTVPLVRGIDDISVPPDFRKSSYYYSIADNDSLQKYLRHKIHTERSVEILQHGISHDYGKEPNRWEFGADYKDRSKLEHKIQQGKTIIHQAFDYEPKFFVPPGEDISHQNLKIIIESGLIPIYRLTLFDIVIRSPLVPNSAKKIVLKKVVEPYGKTNMEKQDSRALFLRPVILSLRSNAVTWSTPSFILGTQTFESLLDSTDQIATCGNVDRLPICILNHYHQYYFDWNSSISKHELFRTWTRILSYFTEEWKVTFSELYERKQRIQGVDISKTGSKITIISKDEIQDFSLRVKRPLVLNDNVIRDEQTDITTIKHISPNRIIVLYEKT